MNKKRLLPTILITIILIINFSACSLLPTEESYVQPPALDTVKVNYIKQTIKRGDMLIEVKASGIITSDKQTDLFYPDFGGYLNEIYIEPLQEVHEGDILIGMNTKELEYNKKQAYYDYATAKTSYEKMIAKGADSYDIKIAGYRKSSMWLRYEKLKNQFEASALIAPFDGVVTYLTDAKIGDYANARQVLVTISDISVLEIEIPSDYPNVSSFPLGSKVIVSTSKYRASQAQTITVSIDEDGEIIRWDGKVSMDEDGNIVIKTPAPTPAVTQPPNVSTPKVKDNADKIYSCVGIIVQTPSSAPAGTLSSDRVTKVQIYETLDDISLGDTVSITRIIDFRENVILINKNAVSVYKDTYIVFVLIDGVKIERHINVGLETLSQYEVLDGLSEGDEVIIN